MPERQLKYRWERTWPDKPNDYVGCDGDLKFGRVQLHTTGPSRYWSWSFWGDSIDLKMPSSNGYDKDKIEACRQLEAAYDEAKANNST